MKNIFTILITLVFINSYANKITDTTFLKSSVTSKSAKENDTIQYEFEIINSTNIQQSFSLKIKNPRDLACTMILPDTLVSVMSNQIFKGIVSVIVSNRIPIGGQESSFLTVENKNSEETEVLEFISVRYKPHPFLLATNDLLEETKQKIENYAWAKENFENLVKEAGAYNIPKREVVLKKRNTREWKSFNYSPNVSEAVFQMALAWQLTGDVSLRNQAVQFVKDVCDKEKGYLSIGAATTGVQVHEGVFFMYLAATCDLLYEASVFSESDRNNIEATFRYYLKQNGEHMSGVGIMNHQASANAGAIFVALFLQDMAEIKHLTYADGGMVDQISKGTMADGWWFEGTVNYSYLVTYKYTKVAQAYENYGWNLYDKRFPTKHKSIDFDNAKDGYTGMKFDIWGPTGKNTRGLEEMFSGFVPMMDQNAFVVSSNDSGTTAPHQFYELAYRHFRKDELAWVLNHSKRDSWEALIYGVAEIPEIDDPRTKSDVVSNVGLTALRSQKEGGTSENQIQAYTKFGTHGGWHGHFDRASLIALDRNGHKYFGTEMAWFGYGHAGYKESVQTSATHNMVIVDELQQEAVPSEQLLFHAGKMMQVSVLETNARWRKIPTFNPELFPPWNDKEYDPGFEPIQQKRLTIVTDDYVVVADYMKSSQSHNYDCLLHPIGLKSIDGAKKNGKVLDALSTKFDSPYKYFKNAQWYKMNKEAKLHFEDGDANLDVHTIWPKKANVVIANYPNGGKHRDIRNNPDRKTYGIRLHAKNAYFLNVIEPYKGNSEILKIASKSENIITVYLTGGRKQIITIDNFENEDTKVTIDEFVDGVLINSEKTNSIGITGKQ